MNQRQHRTYVPRSEHGSVLIVTMWITFGLISIALFFGHSMMMEYRAASNSARGLQASHAIEGARRYVAFVLGELEEPGYLPDIEDYETEAVPVGGGAFWLLGRGDDDGLREAVPVYGLVDEASKLNLNTATREMLEALPDMPTELAAAIIDWRDTDSDLTPDGAEAQNYLLLETPYNCKDAEFETVEELRLVLGADLELLFGEDMNRNGLLDPNEDDGDASYPNDNADGILDCGLVEYLTVYSRELNKQSDGSERIDVTRGGQELNQLIQETFGDGSGVTPATGTSLLQFYIASGMTADQFAEVEDKLTASSEAYQRGLVNVNTAPAEVLACLPGIGESYAELLVSYRQGRERDELMSIAWVRDALGDDEAAIAAGPCITTRSYQFSADIVAVGDKGRGYARNLLVFDTSAGEAQVVYRRDLGRFGWPLGEEMRAMLDTGEYNGNEEEWL